MVLIHVGGLNFELSQPLHLFQGLEMFGSASLDVQLIQGFFASCDLFKFPSQSQPQMISGIRTAPEVMIA